MVHTTAANAANIATAAPPSSQLKPPPLPTQTLAEAAAAAAAEAEAEAWRETVEEKWRREWLAGMSHTL